MRSTEQTGITTGERGSFYSPLLQKGLREASRIHAGQLRKGSDIPYVTHVMAVGMILARVTSNENTIVGGIMHDSVEDCKPYGSITIAWISREFNSEVARIVEDVTEPDKSLPWETRKQAALDHIKFMQQDSLLVKSADVLHNLSELNLDIENQGLQVFTKFNTSTEKTITRYKNLTAELVRVWPDNPLISDIESGLTRLLHLVHATG